MEIRRCVGGGVQVMDIEGNMLKKKPGNQE